MAIKSEKTKEGMTFYDVRKIGHIDLLEKVRWYFETMDAMDTVRTLLEISKLLPSKFEQPKRYGAYRRLAIMAGEAESNLRELITSRLALTLKAAAIK